MDHAGQELRRQLVAQQLPNNLPSGELESDKPDRLLQRHGPELLGHRLDFGAVSRRIESVSGQRLLLRRVHEPALHQVQSGAGKHVGDVHLRSSSEPERHVQLRFLRGATYSVGRGRRF